MIINLRYFRIFIGLLHLARKKYHRETTRLNTREKQNFFAKKTMKYIRSHPVSMYYDSYFMLFSFLVHVVAGSQSLRSYSYTLISIVTIKQINTKQKTEKKDY